MSYEFDNNSVNWTAFTVNSQRTQLDNSNIKSQNKIKSEANELHTSYEQQAEQKQEPEVMIAQQIRGRGTHIRSKQMVAESKFQKHEDFMVGQEIVDLNRHLFSSIVLLCRQQNLISQQIYHDFMTNHTIGTDKDYIEKYRTNKLRKFDYEKCKISLFDHRKLVNMLVQHNSQKYVPLSKPQKPYDFRRQTHEFLKDIYQMKESQYERERDQQIIKYCQHWWGGPKRVDPLVDPPLKFYETEEGQKARIARETAIHVETQEQTKQRNKRVRDQRTTSDDLKAMALQMNYKLFGGNAEVKLQSDSNTNSHYNSKSIYDESQSAQRNTKKGKKERKQKKVKKEKKSRKDRKVKGDQEVKQEDDDYRPGNE